MTPQYVSSSKCTITLRAATSIIEKAMQGSDPDAIDAAKLAFTNFRASVNDSSYSECWRQRELEVRLPSHWWNVWGNEPELKGCQALATTLHKLLLSACGSERNWSDQKYVRTDRRNRMKDAMADKLVNIYCNSEIVDDLATSSDLNRRYSAKKSDRKTRDQGKKLNYLELLKHCDQDPSFVHPTFRTEIPLSNFDDMYEEECIADDDDYDSNCEHDFERNVIRPSKRYINSEVSDSSEDEENDIHAEYVGDILPCPDEILKGLKENSRIVVYFDDEVDCGWFEGILIQVYKRKKKKDNCTAQFNDGIANFVATRENYGRKGMWVLLPDEIAIVPS